MTRALTPRVRLGLWVGLILLIVIPWTDFQDHTHWSRVGWVPFVSRPRRLSDVVVNVLLYLPFGYWFVQQASAPSGRIWRAIAFAAVLSVGTEWSQLYSHSRFTSMTDLTCNLLGTWGGAWWGRRRLRRFVVAGLNPARDDRSVGQDQTGRDDISGH